MAQLQRNNVWHDRDSGWSHPGERAFSGAPAHAPSRRVGMDRTAPQNWDDLRHELEDLLDEVHMRQHDQQIHASPSPHSDQYFEAGEFPDPGFSYPYRHRPLEREEMDSPDPVHAGPGSAHDEFSGRQERHRRALASVQRAVERCNETQEAYSMPAQSQHQLQNAIRQIRSGRRGGSAPVSGRAHRPVSAPPPNQPLVAPGGYRLDEFGQILADISDRLESLELTISGQRDSGQAVADMAMQLEQLSGVVEHLANNIGERGHIKRLEDQIARMAEALPEGAELDFNALNERIDLLTGAFEKLQELQTRQIEVNAQQADGARAMQAIETGVRNIYERLDGMEAEQPDMKPVETCVRSVYERIDALEKSMAVPDPAIERLSQEMAEFTKAMQKGGARGSPAELVSRVEGLIARIEQIESEGGPVCALKLDMQELHGAVLDALEPRFAALENRIGSLSDKITAAPSAGGGADISVDALEKHIQALSEKMDRTSSELNGLQRLFDQNAKTQQVPDIDAIADVVADRTARAMEKVRQTSASGIEKDALDKLENRLAGLLRSHAQEKPKPPQGLQEFVGVQNSINQVNQRLARLEAALSGSAGNSGPASRNGSAPPPPRSPGPEDSTPPAGVGKTDPQGEGKAAPQSPRRIPHPGLAGESGTHQEKGGARPDSGGSASTGSHLLPELRDNMPHPPAQEGPLRDTVFSRKPDVEKKITLPDALRVDPDDLQFSESEVHEIDEPRPVRSVPSGAPDAGRPRFDARNTTRPPAPKSDFAPGSSPQPEGGGSSGTAQGNSAPSRSANDSPRQVRTLAGSDVPVQETVSRSTFIEAARRAARAKNAEAGSQSSNSLIGRALARFQNRKNGENGEETDQAGQERKTLSDGALSSSQGAAAAAGNPEERKPYTVINKDAPEPELDDLAVVPQSFLSRHRQPILLAATLVAVALLTLNLVSQRMGAASGSSPDPVAAVSSASPDAADQPAPQAREASPLAPGEQDTPPGQDDGVSGEIVGSIHPASGQPADEVRVIDPQENAQMPASLSGANLNSASVNLASLTLDSENSPIAFELPPEAIGPLLLRQTAANGDARAQFEVGAILAEGRVLPQDLAAAAKWYERAAAQGFAPAGYRLANMLENGAGIEKDLTRARLWYQMAADAGNRMSMHNLASLLASGELGEQQFDTAAFWFEKAAALGLRDSQFNLGMLYARGLGVPQSLENSFKWFSIAARNGDEDAARARDDVARSLDAARVAELRSEVAGWEPAELNLKANFAPLGTWSPDFDPGPAIDNREVIIRVQAALNGLGFDTGTPDGVIGPKTVQAIRGFEEETGMVPSGAVNPRLLAVLGSQPV